MIVASKKQVTCTFMPSAPGPHEVYTGSITKLGLDIGGTTGGRMLWAVYAPTDGGHGALIVRPASRQKHCGRPKGRPHFLISYRRAHMPFIASSTSELSMCLLTSNDFGIIFNLAIESILLCKAFTFTLPCGS